MLSKLNILQVNPEVFADGRKVKYMVMLVMIFDFFLFS